MDTLNLAGILSISLLLIAAFLFILNFREGKFPFIALAIYLVQVAFIGLVTTGVIPLNPDVNFYLGSINNLLDAPLILAFMLYFCKKESTKKIIGTTIGVLFLFDLVVFLFTGLSNRFLTLILGPGLFAVTVFAFYFFANQLKASMYQRKLVGKAFMSGGLVFTYLCFLFIYVMFYILESKQIADIFMIYHITYIIFSLALIIGLTTIMKSKMIKPKPVQKVRREDPNAFQYL